jgi:hypothetical protein
MRKLTVFCIIFAGFFLVALGANVAVAQGSHFQDRDACIADCRAMSARGSTYVGDRRVDPKMVYAMCVQKCDKRFWNDVESEAEDE